MDEPASHCKYPTAKWRMRLKKKRWSHDLKMAEGNDFGTVDLSEEEIAFAVTLAEPLKEENVDRFLEIYDSIPAKVEIERVELIKDMARQLAALPRIPKQFELYRSRKFLSSDSFSAVNVGGKVFKEKLELQLNPDVIHEELKNAEKIIELKCVESKDKHLELLNDTKKPDQFCGNKKRRKAKKSKSDNSESTCRSSVLDNVKPDEGICDSPCKVDSNDKKSGDDDHVEREDESCEIVDKSPSESDYYSAEGGCLPSPTVADSPPFGFPLSTDKLFESAMVLLSKHNEDKPSISTLATVVPETFSQSSTELLPDSATKSSDSSTSNNNYVSSSSQNAGCDEVTASDARTKGDTISPQHKEKVHHNTYFIEEFDNAKPRLESEVVSNDNSNLLALEEEGWQSQTRRHNKKKKKESTARNVASNEKYNQHLDKLQKKEQNFVKQGQRHGGNRFGNDNYKKNKGNKTFKENRFPSNRKDYEEKCKRWINGETPSAEAVACGVEDSAVGRDICEEAKKSAAVDCQDSKPKLLSYRDALLKSKSREDLHYSSDSGVDANSVSSSCDSVVPQPELPISPQLLLPVVARCDKLASTVPVGEACLAISPETDATRGYNHEEVINYLWETWTVVQEKCKRGLVARYNDKREEQVVPSRLSNQAKSRSPGWGQRHRRGKIY